MDSPCRIACRRIFRPFKQRPNSGGFCNLSYSFSVKLDLGVLPVKPFKKYSNPSTSLDNKLLTPKQIIFLKLQTQFAKKTHSKIKIKMSNQNNFLDVFCFLYSETISPNSMFKAPIDMKSSFKESKSEANKATRLIANKISAGVIHLIKIKNILNTQNKKLVTPKI